MLNYLITHRTSVCNVKLGLFSLVVAKIAIHFNNRCVSVITLVEPILLFVGLVVDYGLPNLISLESLPTLNTFSLHICLINCFMDVCIIRDLRRVCACGGDGSCSQILILMNICIFERLELLSHFILL